jgi:hypothetical protein
MVELLAMTLGGRAVSAGIFRKIQNSAKKAKCDYDQATGGSCRKRTGSRLCWQILNRCVLNQDGGVPSHQEFAVSRQIVFHYRFTFAAVESPHSFPGLQLVFGHPLMLLQMFGPGGNEHFHSEVIGSLQVFI